MAAAGALRPVRVRVDVERYSTPSEFEEDREQYYKLRAAIQIKYEHAVRVDYGSFASGRVFVAFHLGLHAYMHDESLMTYNYLLSFYR